MDATGILASSTQYDADLKMSYKSLLHVLTFARQPGTGACPPRADGDRWSPMQRRAARHRPGQYLGRQERSPGAILALTLVIAYEVFARYVFLAPTVGVRRELHAVRHAVHDGGAYTLAATATCAATSSTGMFSPRTQATFDLVLYFLFFLPGMAAFIYSGWLGFVKLSWMMNEHSSFSPDGPPVYPFKALIPIAGALMLLQGVAEIVRCIDLPSAPAAGRSGCTTWKSSRKIILDRPRRKPRRRRTCRARGR